MHITARADNTTARTWSAIQSYEERKTRMTEEAGVLEKMPPKLDTGAGEFWYDNANGAVDTVPR